MILDPNQEVFLSDGNRFFHGFNPSCPWLLGKDPAFVSITLAEALRQGYVPCPCCSRRPRWI